jgi:hypothetical protein
MKPVRMANRSSERSFFVQMLEQSVDERIMLISGDRSKGKTTLVDAIRWSCHQSNIKPVFIDLKSVSTIDEFYDVMINDCGDCIFAKDVGRPKAANYSSNTCNINLKDITVKNLSHMEVNAVVNYDDHMRLNQMNARLGELNSDFFQRLDRNIKIVFIFDSFDGAIKEIKEWVRNRFLRVLSIKDVSNWFVVIAGWEDGDLNYEWMPHAHKFQLADIKDHQAWFAYASEFTDRIPETEIANLCKASRGDPSTMRFLVGNMCEDRKNHE